MSATVEIRGDGKHFEGTLDAMRHKMEHFSHEIRGMATKFAAGFAAERLIEHVVEAIGEATAGYKEFAQDVERTTALLGENADEVQRVAFAAKLANADFGELQKGMLMIRKTQGDALRGNPDAKETFANMGIDPEQFGAAKLTEQVLMLADSFAKLDEKSDRVDRFMTALGTKNRAIIQMIAEGRHELEHEMAETPMLSGGNLAAEKAARKQRLEHEAHLRSQIGDSGIIETQDKMHELGTGLGGGVLKFLNAVHDAAISTANVLGTNEEGALTTPERIEEARRKAILDDFHMKPSDVKDFGPRPGSHAAAAAEHAEHGAEHADTHDAHSAGGLKPPATVAFANASTRAAMAESEREMDFRNAMLLQDNLAERAKSLKGEQLRILTDATQETDPKRAFSLMMKGKGMESEIIAAMKQLNAPDMLTVKSGRIREMGGGGPMSMFGGVEVQIRDSLRSIDSKLTGVAANFVRNPETGQVGSVDVAALAGFGIGGITRILTNTPNFVPER